MTVYMCMCIFLTNATACRDDIQINTVKAQSTVITEIRLYPAEGPMPRASEAPFALDDIVRCSKSWTIVDTGRCSQCGPTNGHPEEDGFHDQSPERRRRTSSHGIAPQKPNRRSPRVGLSGGRGFQRHLLSRYSVRVEVRDGEDRGLRRCGFSQERLRKMGSGLTKDCDRGRDKDNGESQETGSGRDGN